MTPNDRLQIKIKIVCVACSLLVATSQNIPFSLPGECLDISITSSKFQIRRAVKGNAHASPIESEGNYTAHTVTPEVDALL